MVETNELQGKRIFIVEDDMMNMAVNSAALRRSGAIIIQDLLNLDTVHKLAAHLPIDVILLDLMLRQQLNGYDVYDAIKQHPRLQHIPVIAVSAADPHIEIPKAKAKGFAGFIGKPVKPFWFARQIAACMHGNSVWYAQDRASLDDYALDWQ